MAREVTLGAHTYTVRPQKIGYLINKLGPNLQAALEAEVEGIVGAALVGAKARDVLAVFIPDLMPTWEFLGYDSQAAMAANEYKEHQDTSPEPLEIKDAFKAASDVNGGEVLGHLKGLLGPALTQRVSAAIVALMAEKLPSISATPVPSPTSPPMHGESAQTNSGTSAPTSPPSVD